MNSYLRQIFFYFEAVLHPASGWADTGTTQKKRKSQKPNASKQPSPDCFNMRAVAKKGDKNRRNPAP
ncbi:MAG TPA: hypothetical protein VFQ73_13450 [Flavisolibacter sp.]|nr:hypothetical protein [Flavisolibacter sp.]